MTRRPHPLRTALVVVGIVVLAVAVAADVILRQAAEEELAARVQEEVPAAETTSARIRSFPFLGRLLVSGNVSEIDARLDDVTVEQLLFDFIAVRLHGVEVERDTLLGDRRVVLKRIDRGQVRAEVSEEALVDVLGLPVTLEDGRASVEILGQQVGAGLAIQEGRLVVSGLDISLPALDLTGPLLPCVSNVEILAGRLALTCDFTEIPRELLVSAPL
ncbi:MAG: LmeA family phospholipid-binding protein [Acidimicrobiales bacterium]